MKARILLIEDNADNLELARYLLAAAGHEVLLATNGAQGLDVARAEQPDMIVSDLQMPVMDGYALIAALKCDPSCLGIPVIALTAFSMPGDEARVMQAGFDGYLSKPIEPEQFSAQIADLLSSNRRAAESPPAAA
ncbi:MAG: response regulator [Burkholderiaceae bacterium]|nr:response regulator [Burkholderiaceae bacterium]